MKLITTFATIATMLVAMPHLVVAEDRVYDLAPFTEVEISSGINAEIAVGPVQSVTASAKSADLLDEIKIEVQNGRLKAYADWTIFNIFSMGDRQTRVTITVPRLISVDGNSGADVNVDAMSGDAVIIRASSGADVEVKAVTATSVTLEASSGSDLSLAGTCDALKANASSGSDIRAEKLLCVDADLNASSGSDLDAYASASAKANASSGSSIAIHGNPPKVEKEESSGGDIDLES